MKTSLCCVIAAGILVAAAFAADAPDDAKGIQGTWLPTKGELGGKPVPDAVLKKISLKLDDGNYLATVSGEPDKGTYMLDSKSKPKGITVKGTEGPNKGKAFPAIYELQDDTLRICYDLSETKRPTEFTTAAGTQLYLVTYKRKSSDPPSGLEFLRTVPELRGITLKISEQDFLKLVQSQKLEVKPDHSRTGETSYFITTPSGENIVVMFADGACKGIQRLQPTPAKHS